MIYRKANRLWHHLGRVWREGARSAPVPDMGVIWLSPLPRWRGKCGQHLSRMPSLNRGPCAAPYRVIFFNYVAKLHVLAPWAAFCMAALFLVSWRLLTQSSQFQPITKFADCHEQEVVSIVLPFGKDASFSSLRCLTSLHCEKQHMAQSA